MATECVETAAAVRRPREDYVAPDASSGVARQARNQTAGDFKQLSGSRKQFQAPTC